MSYAKRLRRKMKKEQAANRRRKVLFEPLEPRLLLSGDLSYAMAGAAHDLTLRLQEVEGVDTFQLIDNNDPNEATRVVAAMAAAETTGVNIAGSAEEDRLTVDYTRPFGDLPIAFRDLSGVDNDFLRIVGRERTAWNVMGADSGQAAGMVFSGIENLSGAANNEDTFIFEEGGSLSGVLDGGEAGFDTLVIGEGVHHTAIFTPTGPDSGFVDLDGNRIAYAGLEPIDYSGSAEDMVFDLSGSGDDAVLEMIETPERHLRLRSENGTFEQTDFAMPGSLTLLRKLKFQKKGYILSDWNYYKNGERCQAKKIVPPGGKR